MATAVNAPSPLPSVNPAQLIELLTKALPARRPILIAGAPGIGKTELAKFVCRSLGFRILMSHPAVNDPTDYKGLPWFDATKNTAQFFPLGEFGLALQATEPTAWILDDVSQAPEATQAALMQLLLERRVGDNILPDCVTFVSCANGRQHRAGARGLLEPVKSRFATIVELVPDIDSWTLWANRNGINPMTVAYLNYKPESLSCFEPSADLTNSPNPRTWEHVSQIHELDLSPELENTCIDGAVGVRHGTEYATFRTMYRSLVNVDDILAAPKTAAIPTSIDQLCAVSVALAARATAQNISKVLTYCERMATSGRGDYASLTVRSATDRDAKLLYTDAYVRSQTGILGQLVTGSC